MLKNVTDNEELMINTTAIKTTTKITYYQNNDFYTLKILSSNKLILQRKNTEMESTITFELGKIIPCFYYIKEQDITLEINIKTNSIEVFNNKIDIHYTVMDSNTDYQYKIEMSD